MNDEIKRYILENEINEYLKTGIIDKAGEKFNLYDKITKLNRLI